MTQIPDSTLAAQILAGDTAGFEALARRYQSVLLRYFRLYHSPDDAAELVQETFLQVWKGISNYDVRWCFSTWLYTIAHRQSGMLLRKKMRDPVRKHIDSSVEIDKIPQHFDVSERTPLEREEESRNLWTEIAKLLPAEQVDVLWLFYVEEKSLREIAFIQNRTLSSVKTLMFRARKTISVKYKTPFE